MLTSSGICPISKYLLVFKGLLMDFLGFTMILLEDFKSGGYILETQYIEVLTILLKPFFRISKYILQT